MKQRPVFAPFKENKMNKEIKVKIIKEGYSEIFEKTVEEYLNKGWQLQNTGAVLNSTTGMVTMWACLICEVYQPPINTDIRKSIPTTILND